MSKLKKRLLIALTLFCSFFALVACSENKIADKPENSAVYDHAKVLSKETIKTIDKMNEEADNTNEKLKIGVYIMEDLNDKDLEDTTLEIARKWKIGDKGTDNGVLLFLAINDKKSRLEVSDNLATRLTDAGDFADIIVHCQAGVSRSHAVALFIAKYFAKDDAEYRRLLNQENKVYGGNHYAYNKLIENLERNE